MWLRADAYSKIELVLANQGPPSTAPDLPDGIDVVWVGLGPPDPAEATLALWRVRPSGAWEQIRAPRS